MNDYELAAKAKFSDKLKDWTSPEAVLKDLALVNKFWTQIQLLNIPEFNSEEIKIAAAALEKLGIPLPWPKEEPADNTQVMLLKDAVQFLAAFEEAIIDELVITKTELALSLLFMPEKFVLTMTNFVNRFLDWLMNRESGGALAYWRVLIEVLGSTLFLMMMGPAFATIKTMFGKVMMPIWIQIPDSVLFQSTGPRIRKRKRTRIAHEVRPARR